MPEINRDTEMISLSTVRPQNVSLKLLSIQVEQLMCLQGHPMQDGDGIQLAGMQAITGVLATS
jgi:hypothetical protein